MSRILRIAHRTRRFALTVKAASLALLVSPSMAFSPLVAAAAAPVDPLAAYFATNAEDREVAIDCMGEAVYYEAGFESTEGQLAVAQVILNRVQDPYYPSTVCGVVYQGWERKTGCQFSFACDGSLVRRPPTAAQREQAEEIARRALSGKKIAELGEATHYHTDYVDPYWAPGLDKVATVGTHIFYENPYRADFNPYLYAGGEAQVRASVAMLQS